MRQKELEKWLKIVIIAVALCGLVVCAVAIPWIGHVLIAPDPQISDMYIPWLVLFIISAIPCYVILYLGWRVAVNIGKDRSFSLENARHIKLASKIILFDALYFFCCECLHVENICESSGGDTGSCVHSVCLCCGIGRGGGFVTSCGKGRRSAGAE